MNTLNQNTIMASLNQALVPSSVLIDGRTEIDWLSFMSHFASLINFYDANNNVNGNWSPFLLKDPVILLASISKTNVSKIHTIYLKTCIRAEQLLKSNVLNDLYVHFNQLYEQLITLFLKIEQWLFYMSKSDQEYGLKKYIKYQTQNTYSEILWALIALQRHLLLNNMVVGLNPIAHNLFEHSDPIIWKKNKNKRPFWEVLHLNELLIGNTITEIFDVFKKTMDQIFVFFNTIVKHAHDAFEKLKEKRGKFPDAILLRTFINLLMIHKDQLNGITQKHLDFYYTDILKQTVRNALPDSVYIAIQLVKKDLVYSLPQGTLFDAGTDDQKNPIVFASLKNTVINPASIVSAQTLTSLVVDNVKNLYCQKIATPAIIQKDEEGKILSWPSFGGNYPPVATVIKTGFSIASPLLLLKEGNRNIEITLTFNSEDALPFLNSASYCLSTQVAWYTIKPTITTTETNNVVLNIALTNIEPPIEAFVVNPDNYITNWPLLKITFNVCTTVATVPVINTIAIAVTVTGITSLNLFNDYGALNTKSPFQLFGPTPNIDSNFIIGSNEIFSKPLQSLYFDVTWDSLPDNFQSYYQEYNNYLDFLGINKTTISTGQLVVVSDKNKSVVSQIVSSITHGLTSITQAIAKKAMTEIANLLTEIKQLLNILVDDEPINYKEPFNNTCFTVNFEKLTNNEWDKVNIAKLETISINSNNIITSTPYKVNNSCNPTDKSTDDLLFSTQNYTNITCKLTDKSFFGYTNIQLNTNLLPEKTTQIDFVPINTALATPTIINNNPDPTIQNQPLDYTNNSKTGFIKMILKGPASYGFGSGVYPEVVANIALQNALKISKDPKIDPKKLLTAAKIPFSPKVKSIVAHYTAYQLCNITQTLPNQYPIECFAYAPFINYKIYDNNLNLSNYNYNVGDNNVVSSTNGIPLFASMHSYQGFLYIEITNVVAPSSINLYVELARKEGDVYNATNPDYFYLSSNGWQALPLLSNTTNNFSCSGIISFNVPADISNQTTLMPNKNYWICIATKSDISKYGQITFLQTNGVLLTRSGSEYLSSTNIPNINQAVITKPHQAIPEIASIVQPFPSFGGKAMEDNNLKNVRVSNRLKNKDRAVSPTDYFQLIQQEFNNIYYAKTYFDCSSKSTTVYVVKKEDNYTNSNAFTPLVTQCTEIKISDFLKQRASSFSIINVKNFVFLYTTINATIILSEGYEWQGVQKEVIAALNLFLSPWITSSIPQVNIDEPLTDLQVVQFIKTIAGVASVGQVTFSTIGTYPNGNVVSQNNVLSISLATNPELLIVSSMQHIINEGA